MERIIISCDPGHDDAYALAIARGLSDKIKVEMIIATYGNQSIAKTLTNALNLAQALDYDCPTYTGSLSPLVRERVAAGNIHGENGLEGPVFPECRRLCQGKGILAAIRLVGENPGEITFVSVGPMTDLAVCMKADPEFARKLKRIVVMGGSMGHGNATDFAEFNVFADPEAAHIVYSSGTDIVMFGLDVTTKVLFKERQLSLAKALPESTFKPILLASIDYYTQTVINALRECPAMHDPCTIVYLADPSVFTFEKHTIKVDVSGKESYGQTVAGKPDGRHDILVGVNADVDRFWEIFFGALRNLN